MEHAPLRPDTGTNRCAAPGAVGEPTAPGWSPRIVVNLIGTTKEASDEPSV